MDAKLRPLETIDFTKLKGAIKELNTSGLLETPIKLVAVKKEDLIEKFVNTVRSLPEDDLTDNVVDAFNHLFTPPADDPKEEEEEEEEKKESPKKESPKKESPKKEPAKRGRTDMSNIPRRDLNFGGNFDALKTFLAEAKNNTNKMDKLLLNGGTLEELLKDHQAICGPSNFFKTPSRIKDHVAYREKHSNWVFEKKEETVKVEDKDVETYYVKLISVKPKVVKKEETNKEKSGE